MKQVWAKELPLRWVWLVMLGLVLILFVRMTSPSWVLYSYSFDVANHLRGISSAKAALLLGQFPVRSMSFQGFPWHYPYFQFYGSIPYTFAGLLSVLLPGLSTYSIFKLTMLIPEVVGGFYFYRLMSRWVGASLPALLGAIVYLYTPYNICDIMYLSAYTEVIAIGIIPVVLFYTVSLYEAPTAMLFLKTSLAWFFLLTSHLITAIYFSLTLGLYFLIVTVLKRNKLKSLMILAAGYLAGFLLSVWYLWPIITLQSFLFAHIDLAVGLKKMAHDVSLTTLFSLIPHSYEIIGQDVDGPFISNVRPGLGWPILWGILLLVLGLLRAKKLTSWRAEIVALMALFSLIVGLLLAPDGLWSNPPLILQGLQLPRRLLVEATWMGAILSVLGLHYWIQARYSLIAVATMCCLAGLTTFLWLAEVQVVWAKLDSVPIDNTMVSQISYALNNRVYPDVQHVDNVQLSFFLTDTPSNASHSSTSTGKWLKLNEPIDIPLGLLYGAYQPTLYIEGREAANIARPGVSAIVEGQVIRSFPWLTADSVLQIPLQALPNKPFVRVQFNVMGLFPLANASGPYAVLPVSSMYIGGFMQESTVRHLPWVIPYCVVSGNHTYCDLGPQPGVDLVELPMLYYPNMLSLKVNGQSVPYDSVWYGDFLLTGFKPNQTEPNQVDISFVGMLAPNRVSALAWLVWLGVGLTLIWKSRIKKQEARYE